MTMQTAGRKALRVDPSRGNSGVTHSPYERLPETRDARIERGGVSSPHAARAIRLCKRVVSCARRSPIPVGQTVTPSALAWSAAARSLANTTRFCPSRRTIATGLRSRHSYSVSITASTDVSRHIVEQWPQVHRLRVDSIHLPTHCVDSEIEPS